MEKWISVKDRLPNKDGEYLVTYRSDIYPNYRLFVGIYVYSSNLSKVNKWDFPKKKYNRNGWYGCDVEYGYYEVKNVIAWMELPEVYKPKAEKAENKELIVNKDVYDTLTEEQKKFVDIGLSYFNNRK